ncbi:hypothetical protein WJ63_02750 [Burkholderia pyrrocinia]|nr:hypothetical protein WJ63_02750 [Burkholderia pyrrocinia]
MRRAAAGPAAAQAHGATGASIAMMRASDTKRAIRLDPAERCSARHGALVSSPQNQIQGQTMRDQQRSMHDNGATTRRANPDDSAACPPSAAAQPSRAHPLRFPL